MPAEPEALHPAYELIQLANEALAEWNPDPKKPTGLIHPLMVATDLVWTRGSVSDREVARRYLTLPYPGRPGEAEAGRAASERYAKLLLSAALADDPKTLRPEVEALERQLRALSPADQPFPDPANPRLAIAYGVVGDTERSKALSEQCYPAVTSALTVAKVKESLDWNEPYFQRDLKNQRAPAAVLNITHWTNIEAGRDRHDDAITHLLALENKGYAFRALCDLALRQEALGDSFGADSALDSASDLWIQDEISPPFGLDLMSFIDAGKLDFAREAYHAIREDSIARKPEETLLDTAVRFGMAAAYFKDADALKAASKQVIAIADAAEPHIKPRCYLYLAAMARQWGDEAGANAAANEAQALLAEDDVYTTPGFAEVVRATMRAGKPEAGLKLAESWCKVPAFLDTDREVAVGFLVAQGKPFHAWNLTDEMAPASLSRLRARLSVIIALERAGKHAEAMQTLTLVDDPAELAAIALYAARDQQGLRGFGTGNATIWR